jgi:sirohydrochlorin cobaltochelatase
MLHKPDSALLIVGHGSTVNASSSAPTRRHAEAISGRGIFGEVHCAFFKEEPSLRQALHEIGRREIYIVPNFISEGYFTKTVIPRELELTGPTTHRDGRTLKYCAPVGNHPRMTELLLRRAAAVAPEAPAGETSLLIVGHGTSRHENSAAAARREVERIRQRGLYAESLNAYLEEPPLISKWDELTSQPNVVVVPFFIADGLHSGEDIPALLGIEDEPGDAVSHSPRPNPHHLRGRTLYYASAIGTEPLFAEVILDQVEAFDS